VLPGAFSAYRWKALKWDKSGGLDGKKENYKDKKDSILAEYFKTVFNPQISTTIQEANM
jgi:hypothetical protein